MGLFTMPDWYDAGACTGIGKTVNFFPHQGQSGGEAKAVCARCPVQAECLAFALTNSELYGIWGGTSEHERDQLKRRRPRRGGTLLTLTPIAERRNPIIASLPPLKVPA